MTRETLEIYNAITVNSEAWSIHHIVRINNIILFWKIAFTFCFCRKYSQIMNNKHFEQMPIIFPRQWSVTGTGIPVYHLSTYLQATDCRKFLNIKGQNCWSKINIEDKLPWFTQCWTSCVTLLNLSHFICTNNWQHNDKCYVRMTKMSGSHLTLHIYIILSC